MLRTFPRQSLIDNKLTGIITTEARASRNQAVIFIKTFVPYVHYCKEPYDSIVDDHLNAFNLL